MVLANIFSFWLFWWWQEGPLGQGCYCLSHCSWWHLNGWPILSLIKVSGVIRPVHIFKMDKHRKAYKNRRFLKTLCPTKYGEYALYTPRLEAFGVGQNKKIHPIILELHNIVFNCIAPASNYILVAWNCTDGIQKNAAPPILPKNIYFLLSGKSTHQIIPIFGIRLQALCSGHSRVTQER